MRWELCVFYLQRAQKTLETFWNLAGRHVHIYKRDLDCVQNLTPSPRVASWGAPLWNLLPNVSCLSRIITFVSCMLEPIGLPLIRHYMSSLLQSDLFWHMLHRFTLCHAMQICVTPVPLLASQPSGFDMFYTIIRGCARSLVMVLLVVAAICITHMCLHWLIPDSFSLKDVLRQHCAIWHFIDAIHNQQSFLMDWVIWLQPVFVCF